MTMSATLKISKPTASKPTASKPTASKPTATRRTAGVKRQLTTLRRASLAVGGIGVSALGLSVIHCTQSISVLTGSHWTLSAMLAVTIDAGMVASEVADLLSHGSPAHANVKPWALAYVVLAVLLSMVLNAIGMGMHADESMRIGSYVLGAIIPVLVFMLGRVAGYLWVAK